MMNVLIRIKHKLMRLVMMIMMMMMIIIIIIIIIPLSVLVVARSKT